MNPIDNLIPPPSAIRSMLDDLTRADFRARHAAIRARRPLRVPPIYPAIHMSHSDDSEDAPGLELQPNGDPVELVVLDPKEIGMTAGYKNLYSGKEDKHGRFQWQTKIPEDVGKPAEDAEAMKYALLVRHVKVYNDPRRVLSLHSIVVQSPYLKDLLQEVLAGYPGVTVGLQRLEFSGKFEPLVHRWAALTQAIAALKAAATAEGADDVAQARLEHAQLFYDLLSKEFKDVIESATDMMTEGVMTYDLLWTMFQPGGYVYSRIQGQDRVLRLHTAKYGEDSEGAPVCWVSSQYIDHDGIRFGTNRLNVMIHKYDGTQRISHLRIYPLSFHDDPDTLRTKLVERGSKLETLAGTHYRAYNGVGWRLDARGQVERHSVKGRIVIDGYGFNRFMPDQAIYVTRLRAKESDHPTNGRRKHLKLYYSSTGSEINDRDDSGGMPGDGYFAEDMDDEHAPIEVSLTDEQKLIATPVVRGYALKEKLWLNFFLFTITDVPFNGRAFEGLVLPANQKELILGFTATQQEYRTQFDDLIEGKGRGIIILLSGLPGVGKTLTAEAVAEEMRVPLYQMSAADLGYDSRHIELKLQQVLDMCTRWNAILLIDEADVFMEERSLHELERNKLVSCFLRLLEYYEGIMFLTTNRVQTFDAAFQSRIHISINYPELSAESRRTVWENFLKQHDIAQAASREKPLKPLATAAKSTQKETDGITEVDEDKEKVRQELHIKRTMPHAMTKRDIDSLSLMNMNGRQIKNVLKTAQLLASKRGEGLNKGHITTVLDVTQHLHNAHNERESTRSSIFS